MKQFWIAGALVCLPLAVAPARAQGRFGPGGAGGGFVGRIAQRMQQLPAVMTLDPTHSQESQLLKRDDVRHELMLSGDQQVKLNGLLQQSDQSVAQATGAAWRQQMQQMRQNGGFRGLSPQERRQVFQENMQAVQTSVGKAVDQQNQTLEAVLTPGQVQRLHELDLQWRTPMALADPKTGDAFAVTPDQHTKLLGVAQAFQTTQRGVYTKAIQTARQQQQDQAAQNPGQAQPPAAPGQQGRRSFFRANPAQMQAMFGEVQDLVLQQVPTIEKARTDDGAKAMALLTPEQQQKWSAMTGRPFYFVPGEKEDPNLANQGQ